jgi:hypothetical protein
VGVERVTEISQRDGSGTALRYKPAVGHTFTVTPLIRFGYLCVLLSAPLLSWLLRRDPDSQWMYVIASVAVVSVFIAWPRAIHFEEKEIWQRNLFGQVKRIGWDAVDSLSEVEAEGRTTVGGGGTEIVHTRFHRGKELFCNLIEQRTGKRVFIGGF